MKPKKRQKLCHNCEGEIDLDVIVCPFCAADLREEKPELRSSMQPSVKRLSQETKTSHSLYPTPTPVRPAGEETAVSEAPASTVDSLPEAKSKHLFGAATLFTLGVQLFLLGLLMLLFSHNGVVTLRWNAAHWFLYCLGATPFLYFGYRFLDKL